MLRPISAYLLVIAVFGVLMWVIIAQGQQLSPPAGDAPIAGPEAAGNVPAWKQWTANLHNPTGLFLLQIIIILLVARSFGALARMARQPRVIGEIIAGICLGPSVLGWLVPGACDWLFPAESLKALYFLSQVGLIFFMFVIGMEMDAGGIKLKAHHAVMISHVSIVFPFFLGILLAYYLYTGYAPPNTGFLPFALFMGIAMSITAFPVLARILHERKLNSTPLGKLAITCAAADDVTAWCLLATVTAIAKAGSLTSGLLTIGLAIAYIFLMLYLVKPWLSQKIRLISRSNNSTGLLTLMLVVLLLSAWATEAIGIHALFGAFIAGVVMPPSVSLRKLISEKIGDISIILLLPIFFAYTGLRTHVELLSEGQLWLLFLLVLLIAVAGKFGGSMVTAKLMGHSWTNALSIGALMNTRGLVELVALNIGYDLGILSPEIFTVMVLMALTTTMMTGPILDALPGSKMAFMGPPPENAAAATKQALAVPD